ncbi:hypothetical protein [Methylobacterium tardum]|uniref:Uncharacterized protein n=1 Tax=Methylobacterium tardum TaxID=374432 RepID=A0AA37TA58_9HYPH|nr:hypothetical protein [Methylobacterium tardum]URD39579.1 hypothetical protein M6G65_14995 [Methylobacterium tardum]GLS68145.1 hypothetical protein GCM10007890_01570 [Methylobacterium tardum]
MTVRVLRKLADGETDAFSSTAETAGLSLTNVREVFDGAETHSGSHLIGRVGSKERRAAPIMPAGLLVLNQGSRILWFHQELQNELSSVRTEAVTKGVS